MVKGILWDMDGVLADTVEAHYQAWRAFFTERGGAITREQLYATFGMANPEILRLWLGDDLPEETILALAAHKETLFRQAAKGSVKLFPGVIEWLQRARARGYRQAVASSGEMANIVAIVSALDIGNYFDALVSGALLPRCKPDPAVFIQAAASLGVAPSDCLVIEDGIAGVEAARRAGIRCLAVTTTHPAQKLAGADLIVNSLAELDEVTFDRLIS